MLLFLLLACQAPFGADRQDLTGFRVAALSAPAAAAGDPLIPEVAVVVEGRPWSDTPVALHWHWVAPTVDAVSMLTPDTPPDAEGPRPPLVRPSEDARLALVAISPDGEVARAFADPASEAPAWSLGPLSLAALPWTVRTLDSDTLDRRARARTSPVEAIEADGFLRFTARVDGEAEAVTVRWMSTTGTWLELTPDSADWTPGTIELDGSDIETARPGDDGPVTVLALALDREGSAAFRAHDLWVGPEPAGVEIEGRWLAGELPEGRVQATLAADDSSPTGLALVAPEVVGDEISADPLPCTDQAFTPTLLLTQVCTRSELIGLRVVLDAP